MKPGLGITFPFSGEISLKKGRYIPSYKKAFSRVLEGVALNIFSWGKSPHHCVLFSRVCPAQDVLFTSRNDVRKERSVKLLPSKLKGDRLRNQLFLLHLNFIDENKLHSVLKRDVFRRSRGRGPKTFS